MLDCRPEFQVLGEQHQYFGALKRLRLIWNLKFLRLEEPFGTAIQMVVGLGTDITEVPRIARSIERHGERFLKRVYTAGEIAYCLARKKAAAQSFAARFAAKEAGAKALGTGISRGIGWLELEVVRAPGQAPQLRLFGRAAARAERLGVTHISLSLTHTADTALAVVVMER